jgi:hypothetical protein
VFTYQGLTTCTEVDKSWTIMSSAYNHVRSKRGKDERSMAMFIRKEVEHQERPEAAGYRSPTWRMLRALQSLLSATQLQGESAVAAPPFFPNTGRGRVRFWGNEQGSTVFLWDGLDEEGREECKRTIQTRKVWVVWIRARPMKGDCTPRGFENGGKTVFCGKANRSKKEQGKAKAEEGIEDEAPNSDVNPSGRARRQKWWWKRGVVETKLNTVNMTAWVHKECDIMDEDALLRLQGAWENPQQKHKCSVRMDDLEWDYWMGTEVGQLGGYGFQGAIFGVDGSCKDGTMGSGCCKFPGEEADKCA